MLVLFCRFQWRPAQVLHSTVLFLMDLKLKSGSSPMGMQNLIPHSFAQLILQGRCMKILLPRTSQRILFPWLPSSKVEIFKPEECHPCLVINNRLQTTNEVSKDKITIFSTV